MAKSNREHQFEVLLRIFGTDLPVPVTEHRFHPERKFRLDFAWEAQKVAVEVEGATWVKGAHSSGAGIQRDCEKSNLALLAGWRVLRFTSTMLDDNPGQCIALVRQLLSQ